MPGTTQVVYEGTVSWDNADTANTEKTVDISLPEELHGEGLYVVTVTNPSTETALSVVVRNKDTLNGVVKYPELSSFSVPASTPDGLAKLVQGLLVGEGARIVLNNATGLGLTGGFTAAIKVRKV